ncbi:hypothetical protein TNCV_3565881 [Trichonephila clavipes]|nr:hypothetical protein TNCV_3565881 [Trichonephila clavipes]
MTDLYDRWRHHRYPPPQFRYGTEGEGNIFQSPAVMISAVTALETFGPTDLMSAYSTCTRRVFGDIEHRAQAFRSESDVLTTAQKDNKKVA